MNGYITDPHGAFDLHVGIPGDQVARFLGDDYLPTVYESGRRPLKMAFDDQGRGSWEQWWEAPWDFGEEGGMEQGHHVLLRCESVPHAVENFAWLWEEGFTLIPARFKGSHGTIGVVSDAVDWAEQFLAFSARQQWRFSPPMIDYPEFKG